MSESLQFTRDYLRSACAQSQGTVSYSESDEIRLSYRYELERDVTIRALPDSWEIAWYLGGREVERSTEAAPLQLVERLNELFSRLLDDEVWWDAWKPVPPATS
jgi:hypothetical protein